MKIKTGDIVKAKFGSVVFGFTNTSTGRREHFNISPYGIVIHIKPNEKSGEENVEVKIVFDGSVTCYKAEDLEVVSSTGLKNNAVIKPGLKQIQREYSVSPAVMREMLASIPADGLSIVEAFDLYIKAMNWADGERFYRKASGENPEEI